MYLGTLSQLTTNDPALACLETGTPLSVWSFSTLPGVDVVVASQPQDCAAATWTFPTAKKSGEREGREQAPTHLHDHHHGPAYHDHDHGPAHHHDHHHGPDHHHDHHHGPAHHHDHHHGPAHHHDDDVGPGRCHFGHHAIDRAKGLSGSGPGGSRPRLISSNNPGV